MRGMVIVLLALVLMAGSMGLASCSADKTYTLRITTSPNDVAWSGSYTEFGKDGPGATTEISGSGSWQCQVRCRKVTLTVTMEGEGTLHAEIVPGGHTATTMTPFAELTVVAGWD